MKITASPSGFTDGETVFIKGAFFQNGSSNYFGYTKSGDLWIKNSASNTNQRSVKIGEWDGTLIVKSDFADSGYKGEGDYLVKVGYYVGSATSVNWSTNTLAVLLNEPDPTPTLSQTPTPSHSSTPTQSPKPTVTLSPSPTVVYTATPTLTPVQKAEDIASVAGVFVDHPTIEPVQNIDMQLHDSTEVSSRVPYIISSLFVSLGFAILTGVVLLKKKGIL
jgi:hypothetical protein